MCLIRIRDIRTDLNMPTFESSVIDTVTFVKQELSVAVEYISYIVWVNMIGYPLLKTMYRLRGIFNVHVESLNIAVWTRC
jgi:hypothetical protein